VRAGHADTVPAGHGPRGTIVDRVVPLLDIDPDLGELLGPARRRQAHTQILVRLGTLRVGAWDPGTVGAADPHDLGLLVVDGVLAREVLAERIISTELLGAGDVIRARHHGPGASLLRMGVQWSVLADTRIAILDARVTRLLASYPEMLSLLAERMVGRSERLAIDQAISKLTGVDRRLVTLFWHLAERWGRITRDGVSIPLTLSHRMLAQLVGARRPSVSTALAELSRDGVLIRCRDGSWLLTGTPAGPTADPERLVRPRRRFLPEPVRHGQRRAFATHVRAVGDPTVDPTG
jgi:CRP/FNR family transcriptional regulator, cyclic AMP receptor protein